VSLPFTTLRSWIGAVAVALVAALAAAAVVHWRRARFRRRALKELRALESEYRHSGQQAALLAGISQLLRRTAMHIAPHQPVAGLYGMAWLLFLDEAGGTDRFSRGPGRILLSGPYQPEPGHDVEALVRLVEQWLRTVQVQR